MGSLPGLNELICVQLEASFLNNIIRDQTRFLAPHTCRGMNLTDEEGGGRIWGPVWGLQTPPGVPTPSSVCLPPAFGKTPPKANTTLDLPSWLALRLSLFHAVWGRRAVISLIRSLLHARLRLGSAPTATR